MNRFTEYIRLEIEIGKISYGSPIEQNYRAYIKELEHLKYIQLMKSDVKNIDSQELSLEIIMKIVCEYFKINQKKLSISSREESLSYARKIYAFLCEKYTTKTLVKIGKSINRSHSTIINMLDALELRKRFDEKVNNDLKILTEQIESLLPEFKDNADT